MPDTRLVSAHFPRASRYSPDWLISSISGGANSLWLAEWLSEVVELKPGMRVLDLGCGRAAQSIFLAREFGVQVWATDLWFSASENQQRSRDAGVDDRVTAVHADARSLPFEPEFFDAIFCIDSFPYFATDDHYLSYLARFAKPGGVLGLAGACMLQEIDGEIPEHLRGRGGSGRVVPAFAALVAASLGEDRLRHRRARRGHARRLEAMARLAARDLPRERRRDPGCRADAGRYFGYLRLVARRQTGVAIDGPITSVPTDNEDAAAARRVSMYIPTVHFKERRVDETASVDARRALRRAGHAGRRAGWRRTTCRSSWTPPPVRSARSAVMSRATTPWRSTRADVEALAIFQGPRRYVTPSWYPTKAETGKVVPTWNYVVVHAYGLLRFIDDPAGCSPTSSA